MQSGKKGIWPFPDANSLGQDAIAGLVIAAMLIPQGMAYALLAGLPAQVGLYASLLPTAAYALFGSSRYLAVGPVAVVSLMVATATALLSQRHGLDPVPVAASLALASGAILMLMGLLRLGFITHFLSRPVLLGFMGGVAVLIGLSQLPHALGIPVEVREPFALVGELAGNWQSFSLPTLLLAIGTVLLIRLFSGPLARLLQPRLPTAGLIVSRLGALAAVVLGITLALHTGLGERTALVGEIPRGLPSFALPPIELAWLMELLGMAFLISLIGLMESVSVGRALAARDGEDIQPNRELLGLGASNLVAGLSAAYPVTGGLARTLVARDAGAKSPLAGVFAAGGVLLALLFATPVLAMLPRAILAGIILLAVLPLLDFASIRDTWRHNRPDATVALISFASVLILGVELGLLTGLAVSLALLLWRISQPHVAEVGRVPGTEHFRNIRRHQVETRPGLSMIRVDESLQFPNSRFLRDTLLEHLDTHPETRDLVLVCSAINEIDSTALETLEELVRSLAARGIRLHLSEVKGPVLDRLRRAGFPALLAPGRIFFTNQAAFEEIGADKPQQDQSVAQ
ncbi:sulfate permease [Gammaproteobacteria bacterium AB-CW1]|uniref:Sulfate permease n=1 Tax=Natronospira elongata TaxID=3110268 RepID=A0AAP6JFE2_9GAMM|nr:sulfate permease [Gammaproteobacteria bacterium AB-CW1]